MARYKYKVRDRRGRSVSGVADGASAQAVSDSLAAQGYFPIAITEDKMLAEMQIPLPSFLRPKVRRDQLNIFVRQLSVMQKAGVTLLAGLSALKEQSNNEALQNSTLRIMKDLESGSSFSTALSQQPKIYSPLYVHMVRAGEASGKLDEVLENLADMGQFEQMTVDRIKSATLYPSITIATILIAFLGIVHFVIPRFADFYRQFGATLPPVTLLLIGINNLMEHHWLESLMVIGGLVYAFRFYVSKPMGRYQWDWLKLRLPVFGKLLFHIYMSRFARVLADLLKAGVPLLESLQLVSDTVDNRVIEKAILEVRRQVNEGKSMSGTMKSTGLFSPTVVQMMDVGEKSGKTDELLSFISKYYEDIATGMIKNLTTLIEPILIFIIGGMVLLLAVGVFMPVWSLSKVVH